MKNYALGALWTLVWGIYIGMIVPFGTLPHGDRILLILGVLHIAGIFYGAGRRAERTSMGTFSR